MSSNLCLCVSLSQSHTCSNYGFPFGLKSSNVVLDPIDLHYKEKKLKQKKLIKYSSFYSFQFSLSVIFLIKWKVKSSTLHTVYSIPHSVHCLHTWKFCKGYAEKFLKICILWLYVYDCMPFGKHPLCQNLHSPFIQSICNFTSLCIYANDCLDMVDLEIIPKCPAF